MLLLMNNRQVSTEEGEAKATELRVLFLETSAKAGYNVKVYIFKLFILVRFTAKMLQIYCDTFHMLLCSLYSEKLLVHCRGWKHFPLRNRRTWSTLVWSLLLILPRKIKGEAARAREDMSLWWKKDNWIMKYYVCVS